MLDGSLTADGESVGMYSGGGSGGSIYVTVATLTGGGTISANGGDGHADNGGGGGGGRIAIHYDTNTFAGTVSACGGSGWIVGGSGTSFTKASTQDLGDLLIDNCGQSGPVTRLSSPDTLDGVIIAGGALVYLETSLTVNTMHITSGGELSHDGGEIVAMTVGSDLVVDDSSSITASIDITIDGNLTIGSGGSINADGKGYGSASGPGAGGAAYRAGGASESFNLFGNYLSPMPVLT